LDYSVSMETARLLTRREFVATTTATLASARLFGKEPAARTMAPIVSPDWLEANAAGQQVVIVDIRSTAQYDKGHIAGAINVPMADWAVSADGISMELPSDAALRTLLTKSGIAASSHVVIVNRTETDFSRADATRVAWTCILAGVKNTAVLDGGHTRWVKEKRTLTTEKPVPRTTPFTGPIDRSSVVTKQEILSRIGEAIIIDARIPEDYFGIHNGGHIKSAFNLPAPWVFQRDGNYRDTRELRAMADGVIGNDPKKEIVVYCGVGGYAALWWFLMTQLLGYRNVKLYDGSFEEWTRDPAGPVSRFSWK